MKNKKRISEIFNLLSEEIKIPEIELEFDDNPYTLMVAVILSAQSTDKQVNKATEHLFQIVDTPEKMIDLGFDGLCSYVNSVGLYKSKAQRIIDTSKILVEKYNSKLPNTREELMSLPGIGRKSADVILNVLFNKPTVAVDTHVFRVGRRLELSDAGTRDKMAEELEKTLPEALSPAMMQIAHHLLVLHGRYICKARKPDCGNCALYDICNSKDKLSKDMIEAEIKHRIKDGIKKNRIKIIEQAQLHAEWIEEE